MKWNPNEVETYLKSKEYIDSAIVPLYSVSMVEGIKESAEKAEFVTLISEYLEKQFTGRLVLFPPFTYLKNDNTNKQLAELKNWEENLQKAEFKHIFYITSDIEWRNATDRLNGSIIWLPSIPLVQMSDLQKMTMVENQAVQTLSLFTQKWQKKV